MRYDWVRQIGSFQSTTDNVQVAIYDILNVSWKSFVYTQGYIDHVISKTEAQRPWLIAFKFYGDATYEDFIYLINGIKNPLDLIPGQVIRIPTLNDIKAFISNIKQ